MKVPIAGELMSPSPGFCTPRDSLEMAARLMAEYDCGAVPVVDSPLTRRPVGMITDRDIVVRVVAMGRSVPDSLVRDAMTPRVVHVHTDTSFEDCVRVMGEQAVRRLLVVDDRGQVIGILTDGDLARACRCRPECEHLVADLVERVSDRPCRAPLEYATPVITACGQLGQPDHIQD